MRGKRRGARREETKKTREGGARVGPGERERRQGRVEFTWEERWGRWAKMKEAWK